MSQTVFRAAGAFACAVLAGLVFADEPPPKVTAEDVKALVTEWDKVTKAGVAAAGEKKYADAERAFRQAIEFAQKVEGTAHPPRYAILGQSWNNLAICLRQQQKYADTIEPLRAALAARQKAFPAADHPNGHPEVMRTLFVLGDSYRHAGKLSAAERSCREGLEMGRRLYPAGSTNRVLIAPGAYDLSIVLSELGQFASAAALRREALGLLGPEPAGPLRELRLRCLGGLGGDLRHLAQPAEAERVSREALSLARALYPVDAFPKGHLSLANALNNLGATLQIQGKLTEALALTEEAERMHTRLFPPAEYPRGHPITAELLHNSGILRVRRTEYPEGEAKLRAALTMWRKLYPADEYPDGHPRLAAELEAIGFVLRVQGRYKEAEEQVRDALAALRRLYPGDHDMVATTLMQLGRVRSDAGNFAGAERALDEALDMLRRLHPAAAFPNGHPDIQHVLDARAQLDHRRGAPRAAESARAAAAAARQLIGAFALERGEGEALTYSFEHGLTQDRVLSVAGADPATRASAYADVWADKGSLARVFETRHQIARAARNRPEAAEQLAELARARRRRAELLFANADEPAAREAELKTLDARIAELTRVPYLVALAQQRARLERATPDDLRAALPPDTALVDYLQHVSIEYDPAKPGRAGEKLSERYVAFVVTRDKIVWVDLADSDRIEVAVEAWRRAVTGGKEVPAGVPAKVRELVWEGVRKELPQAIKTVYVCPDAALNRVPWAALPGDKPGSIVLDDFAVATVPHAPFLLAHLRPARPSGPNGALVVGGVRYGAAPGAAKSRWDDLRATAKEADDLATLAGQQKLAVTHLSGERATAPAVLRALPGARHAHFATHGFFADRSFHWSFRPSEREYETSALGERVGRGANDPGTAGGGIVTGEALVDLDLSGLELAVLSACETGLGDVASGEGSFGLQRAFHYAGARNVVAALWEVPDVATAALMNEFYRHLWNEKKPVPPVEALRQAQLAVRRSSDRELIDMARRGVKDGAMNLDGVPRGDANGRHPSLWAGFVLSGPGR